MDIKIKSLRKFVTLILIIAIAPIIAGLYGIIHDQLTYTISHEYYTKFKFYQFGLMDAGRVDDFHPRRAVALVGFMATWWMGIPIGVILGLVGLRIDDNRQMFRVTLKAFLITMIIAFATGLIGLAYGKLRLAKTGVDWWLPDGLIDTENFIAVGSMHNFSYLGGLIGLIGGIIYIVRQKKKLIVILNSNDNTEQS